MVLISNTFFKVRKYLTNIASSPVFPPHEDKQQLLNEMGTFFTRKIANIRSDLDNHSPQVCRVDSSDSEIDPPSLIYYLRSRCMTWSVHPRRRLVPWIRFLQNSFPNAWIVSFPQLLRSPTVFLSKVFFHQRGKMPWFFWVWTKSGVGHSVGYGLSYGLSYGLPYGLPKREMAYRKREIAEFRTNVTL